PKWDPGTKAFTWSDLEKQAIPYRKLPEGRGLLSLNAYNSRSRSLNFNTGGTLDAPEYGNYLDDYEWYTVDVPSKDLKKVPFVAAGLRITNPNELEAQRAPLGGYTAILDNGTAPATGMPRAPSISPESWVSDLWNYFMSLDRSNPPT